MSNQPTTVIHHSADFDGIFCREIARKFLPDAELIGWDYGDPEPVVAPGTQLYMLDISVEGLMGWPGLVWIDHHKSALAKWPVGIEGNRVDGVAACRLAWQWFTKEAGLSYPTVFRQQYLDRKVSEPWAVRLAGEYDIWDKRDPDAELFQHGLRSCDLGPLWEGMLTTRGVAGDRIVERLLAGGRVLQYARRREDESVIRELGFTLRFEGLTFLACNAARCNSLLFTAGLAPEHEGCFAFRWTGRDWSVSLYHAPGKEHHDLSLIAVKHGGGGHRGACGFRLAKLPF